MTKIQVTCPSCQKKGLIDVSEEILKNITRGLLAVNVPDIICEHTFIVYVDKNLAIRDYFMADFKIELPQISVPEGITEKKIPSKEVVNLDLIKLNVPAILLTYVLKCIFSKKEAIIIMESSFLNEHVLNFFKFITQDSFEIKIKLLSKEEYKNNKKNYKDYIVFEGNEIINDSDKIIDIKKLKVEKHLVQVFLAESDLSYSYIVFKNEIHKAYNLAKSILERVNQENQKKINFKYIVDLIVEKFNIKLEKMYLDFIVEILKNYFGLEITEASDVGDFLGFI